MTAEQYRYPYLDSSVFIAWLKGEIVDGIDRKRIAEHILRAAERGVYRLCISALTIAEVHKKRGSKRLTEHEQIEILRFFEHDYLDVVSVDRLIGEQAHLFCREYALSPADAIHLACALRAQCDVLLSWDDGLNAVRHPAIRCEKPKTMGQIEMEFIDDDDATNQSTVQRRR